MARTILTSNLTLYVSTTGSDSNNGLSPSTPFLTRNGAWSYIQNQVDVAGFKVAVQLADGTYTDDFIASGNIANANSGSVTFLGNLTTPGKCTINASHNCFGATDGAMYTVTGFRLESGNGNCVAAGAAGSKIVFGLIDFGQTDLQHIQCYEQGAVYSDGTAYTISGGANAHFKGDSSGLIVVENVSVTLANNPAFTYFCQNGAALVCVAGISFSGTGANGTRYYVNENGVIITYADNPATYFPGTYAGSVGSGGQIL